MTKSGDRIEIHPPNREPEPIHDCFMKVEKYCCPFDEDEGRVAAKVPSDLDLSETSLNDKDLWESLQGLFDACRCEGVSYSKITKILHKKRPRLIPVVDGKYVAGEYLGNSWLGASAGDVPEYLVAATKRIRNDVTCENNRETLIALQERLRQEKQTHLTPLRIFDILLYQHYSGKSAN